MVTSSFLCPQQRCPPSSGLNLAAIHGYPLRQYPVDLAVVTSLDKADSRIFQMLSVSVTLLWVIVSYGTLNKLATGEILFAPCLKDVEGLTKERAERHFGEKAA